MNIPPPKVPLNALKKAVATADAEAVSEWHALVIDAGQEAFGRWRENASSHNAERYRQLMDLELAIIARGREVGVYEPKPVGKR